MDTTPERRGEVIDGDLTIDEIERVTGIDLSCTHCQGTGVDPVARRIKRTWLDLLTRLHQVGVERESTRKARAPEKVDIHERAWQKIVDLWENEARPMGLTRGLVAKATGLSRMSFWEGMNTHRSVTHHTEARREAS